MTSAMITVMGLMMMFYPVIDCAKRFGLRHDAVMEWMKNLSLQQMVAYQCATIFGIFLTTVGLTLSVWWKALY